MDYRDQDGNGEGLFGARNENSVLFSLDNLNALDSDSNGGGSGSGLNTSGDASGLIDLNTLSKMGGTTSSGDDDIAGGVVMESMVFNQVVAKKSKIHIGIFVAVFVVLVGIIVGVSYSMYTDKAEETAKTKQEALDKANEDLKKAQELQAKIEQLEKEKEAAEIEGKRRSAEQAEIDKELARLREAQMNAQVAAGGADAGAAPAAGGKSDSKSGKKSGGSKDSGGSAAAAAPAAPKTKAPDKNVLISALKAANTKAGKCGKNGSLTVQFNLSNNTAKGVKAVGGSFAKSATEKCILTVVEKHNWPDGTASGIRYTFKL